MVLSALPADCPPALVVQHMPVAFSARLNKEYNCSYVEALDGKPVQRGTVDIAPGGERHMELTGSINGRIKLRRGDPVNVTVLRSMSCSALWQDWANPRSARF
jgi:two-component system chemotaxis response regulator CheB